jgi:hypothetical protein
MTNNLGPTPEQITAMRTTVLQRVTPREARSPHLPKPHRPNRRRFALVTVGIGAVAVALIVTGVIVPDGAGGGATAQAAEFLNSAAITTIETSDPAVSAGEYLRIATNQASGVSDGTQEAPMWLHATRDVLYIPADRSGTWVWERQNLPTTVFFSAAGRAAAEQADADRDLTDPDLNGVLRAEAGAFYGGSPRTERALDDLPRDPVALRDRFYAEYIGGSSSIDEDVWVRVTDLLRTGEVPADLRAALYRTLALIPGVTMVEDEATLDGRTGVALGYTEPARGSITREEIIIDSATGLLIGERRVTLVDQAHLPAGTTVGWSTVQTSVVDQTP